MQSLPALLLAMALVVATSGATAVAAPSFISLSYRDANNNLIPLASTLIFPTTQTGANTTLTLVATNTGSGAGAINSIALAPSAPSSFQLMNLPLLPLSVAAGQQVSIVTIRFSPQQPQSYSTTLALNVNGQNLAIVLSGQGSGPQYTYASSTGTALTAGGTIAFSDTAVGQTSKLTVSVANTGTMDGQIAAITVTGQGLSLTDLPALPLTLHPNTSQSFTLNFAPTQPGSVTGRLNVGNDAFTVTANGIGPRLTFAYTSSDAPTPVSEGGTLQLAPTSVGSSSSINVSVQNTGSSTATISNITLASSSAVFQLDQLPGLPFDLTPGGNFHFLINFNPNNLGILNTTLIVNTSSFIVSGVGTQPQALPDYQFQGPSGNQPPGKQVSLGLSLSSAYPLALQGTLKLSFAPTQFKDDPTVQFANGGRTVNFTIPANSTQALFNGNPTMPLQIGTTAGDILITPSFALQGGFDVTPASPNVLTLTIPQAAPQLVSASITSETLNSFTLNLTGYSTTHTLRQFDIQVTPKPGETFSPTHLTLDVSSAAGTWYQGSASQAFGGTFSVAIPFVLQNGGGAKDFVHRLQSLSITATNDVGISSAFTVAVP